MNNGRPSILLPHSYLSRLKQFLGMHNRSETLTDKDVRDL